MERLGLYDKLLMVPLFTGMDKDELEHIVSKTKFLFRKVEAGDTIVREGDRSGELLFLLEGSMLVETFSDDRTYSVLEEENGCHILQPESAYGLHQRFTRHYRANTLCSLISLDKNETQRLTSMSLIFRLNLMNLISTTLQKECRKPWRRTPASLRQRLVRFMTDRCRIPTGRKIFRIKMRCLADEVNDNRLHISQCLHAMQAEGVVVLRRGYIEVPALEELH